MSATTIDNILLRRRRSHSPGYSKAAQEVNLSAWKKRQTNFKVFTVGHSCHPLGTFIWLLRKHSIEGLVDIRRYPGSKRHPHFSRGNLSGFLAVKDIEYHWLEALGGHRKRSADDPPSVNRGIEDESFRNYADYTATDKFREGVVRLLEIAQHHPTTVMCAEGDYRQPSV